MAQILLSLLFNQDNGEKTTFQKSIKTKLYLKLFGMQKPGTVEEKQKVLPAA